MTDEADTGFDFTGKRLRGPIMTALMSENTLGRHRRDAFRAVAEGAARFGTQYWMGDCADATWRKVAALSGTNRKTLERVRARWP